MLFKSARSPAKASAQVRRAQAEQLRRHYRDHVQPETGILAGDFNLP